MLPPASRFPTSYITLIYDSGRDPMLGGDTFEYGDPIGSIGFDYSSTWGRWTTNYYSFARFAFLEAGFVLVGNISWVHVVFGLQLGKVSEVSLHNLLITGCLGARDGYGSSDLGLDLFVSQNEAIDPVKTEGGSVTVSPEYTMCKASINTFGRAWPLRSRASIHAA